LKQVFFSGLDEIAQVAWGYVQAFIEKVVPYILHFMQVFELLSILKYLTFTEALLHLWDFIEWVLQKGHDILVL